MTTRTRIIVSRQWPIVTYKGVEFQVMISEGEVQARLHELASDISTLSGDTQPVIMGVLNGAVYIVADLSRLLSITHLLGFIGVSSYGDSTTAQHEPQITNDLSCPVVGKDVWLVEDIVETGSTVADVKRHLLQQGAKSVKVCCLLRKIIDGKPCLVQPDLVGFVVPHEFVVGCGLDHQKFYREMPFVGVPVEH